MTWTRLHDACQHQNAQQVMQLTQCFSEEAVMVDDHGSTPLHIACGWGNPPLEVVRCLLAACPQVVADKDVLGNTPLHIAASHPETAPAVVSALIDACPTALSIVNKEGLTALHIACRHAPSNILVISLLIDAYPFALRTRTKMGNPAPSRRKTRNSKEGTQHFVTDTAGKSSGNPIDLWYTESLTHQIRDGSYPLHEAVAAGAPRGVIEMLLKEATDVLLLTNKHGETPLHIALANQSIVDSDLMDILAGTNLSIARVKEKQHGNLPIHTAATHGCSIAVAKKLLEIHPNSIHEKNDHFKTPLDLAMELGRCSEDVVRLFTISDQAEDIRE